MKDVLKAFDKFLAKENLSFNAVVIGGAALIIMDVVDRQTKDVDCLDPKIDSEVKAASIRFAKENSHFNLQQNWLNNGPESLKRDLPVDWPTRLQIVFQGEALNISTLGRIDLLRSKLFAFCDRQSDLSDCIALRPTRSELLECYPWVLDRDASELWPAHILKSFQILAKRCGCEFNP